MTSATRRSPDAALPFAALCAATLLAGADGAAPDYIQLLPAGNIRTRDGRGPFRLEDAAAVIAASELPMPIDENHAIDLAAPQGGSSPARGWIVALEARADGIWGRVNWNATGKALVADRAYRGISPHILCTKDGQVVAIRRASLTNDPNLTDLATLHASQDALNPETTMDLDKLRTALGLPADANEAAIVAAAEAARNASANASTHAAVIGQIGKAVGAAENADAAAVLNAVRTAVDPARVVPVSQVAELQSQLKSLTEGFAKDKAIAFVDGAIAAQKVGVKPLRDHYIARHMADPKSVETELNALPSLHAARTQSSQTQPPATSDTLDETEEKVIALMGTDKAAYLKQRAAMATKTETF